MSCRKCTLSLAAAERDPFHETDLINESVTEAITDDSLTRQSPALDDIT